MFCRPLITNGHLFSVYALPSTSLRCFAIPSPSGSVEKRSK